MLAPIQKKKLIKLFTMFDVNNSGKLKLSDFETIAKKFCKLQGYKSDSQEAIEVVDRFCYRWIYLKGEIERDVHHARGANVTLEEWLIFHENKLNEESFKAHLNKLREIIFEVIDINNNAQIEQSEWRNLFEIYQIPVVYCDETFALIDGDQDGIISREELFQRLDEFYYSQDESAPGNYIFGPI